MNFSAIPRNSLIGKLLRWPLRLLPAEMKVPVLQGPMKGMRWIVGSGDHGYWLGSYEIAIQHRLVRALDAGDTFLDVGAHVGFYTLLGARMVGPQGHVYAFEPLPDNQAFVERHVTMNGLENVTLMPLAISDRSGIASFGAGVSTSTGRIDLTGDLEVKTSSLDELLMAGTIEPPDTLKIDVEGAEVQVLEGAANVLQEHRPKIFLATHGKALHQDCVDFLRSRGYLIEPINADQLLEASELYAYGS